MSPLSDTDKKTASVNSASALQASLYVVATPIGNMGDLSPRAKAVLAAVDRIAAEDTRNTGRLLEALGIHKPLMAHHAHNERQSAEGILACLARGESVALVSDAGTPAVSDPGAVVVHAVAQAGFAVVPIPGPSSVLAVVAASGLVQDAFTFRGFLPAKGRQRLELLAGWLACPEPQVLFEAPHRIKQLFMDLQAAGLGGRVACAGREMTKQFETFYRGTVDELAQLVACDDYAERGEWALVFSGATPDASSTASANASLEAWIGPLLAQLPLKTVVQIIVQASGQPKNTVYEQVLAFKKQQDEHDA